MPVLIHIMVLFWLKSGIALTAACTVVKLQHPFRSTQIYEVVLVSLGKSGEKSSQGFTVLFFLWCLCWWWCPLMLYAMTVEVIGDDEKKVRLKLTRYLRKDGFEFMMCVDDKTAKMANRKLRDTHMLWRFIFCMEERRVRRRGDMFYVIRGYK